jgi:hypothetical protein
MLTVLGNPEACFFSGIKVVFMENRGYNDLRRTAEGGHDAAAYLYAILLYRDNGGAVDDDTTKRYKRQSRWLSNEGCLPFARRPRVRSIPRLGAFGVNRCCLRHRCTAISRAQATTVAVAWKRMASNFFVLQRRP